jgi:glycosyltransferase involved in cell wall biosynthesis
MRVLLWMIGGDLIPGGHRVQLEQTSRHLRALGIDADVSFVEDADPTVYDVVHGFGLPPAVIRACRQAGVPVVLSTIYWGRSYTMAIRAPRRSALHWAARARIGLSLLAAGLLSTHADKCDQMVQRLTQFRMMYESADLLLPNSRSEADAIQRELGVTTPFYVVPNSVDPATFMLDEQGAPTRAGALYAGRIEPHKNQLALIRAMSKSAIHTRIVGPAHRDHAAYHEACRRQAARTGGRVEILPGIPHDELAPLYRSAKVHVLPSLFETTGLVSLEAALCGCNIVTTDRGYARDYFGNLAWYCNPDDPASIRQAVEQAHAAPFRAELRERVLATYTWEHTAQATAEAYRSVLRRAPKQTPDEPEGALVAQPEV